MVKVGNIEVYGVIYKIVNTVNGKVYIGQTIQAGGFNARYRGNLSNTTNGHLKASIEKYGLESFKVIEVYDVAFSKEELDIKEQLYIKQYKSYEPQYGYNKELGGANGSPTEETRKKLSRAKIGKTPSEETRKKLSRANKGKKKVCFTEETRKKMSEANRGKIISVETRKKISETNKVRMNRPEIKKKISETNKKKLNRPEIKKKISEAMKGNKNRAKAIFCINTGIKFDTIAEAREWAELKSNDGLIKVCKGQRNYAGKHPITKEPLRWVYYDEYMQKVQQGQAKHPAIIEFYKLIGKEHLLTM